MFEVFDRLEEVLKPIGSRVGTLTTSSGNAFLDQDVDIVFWEHVSRSRRSHLQEWLSSYTQALVGGFPTWAPRKLSQWVFFSLFFSSLARCQSGAFYTIARGSVVREFDVTVDPSSNEIMLLCGCCSVCTERCHAMPSRAFRDETC